MTPLEIERVAIALFLKKNGPKARWDTFPERYKRGYLELAETAIETIRSDADEIKRLRAALKECGAPFVSPPTTVMVASAYVAEEFERRMNIAANTLNDGTRPAPTAIGVTTREPSKHTEGI